MNYDKKVLQLKEDIVKMIYLAGSGHVGGSLSVLDILVALYYNVLNVDPKNPQMEDRDRFVLSKGHACPALYAVLADKGYFPKEDLWTLRKLGSHLQGHPDSRTTPGIDCNSGSLGQGVSCALGMALGLQLQGKPNMVYAIIGDGEAQEGQVWETMMIAPNKKVKNFIVLLDNNEQQLDGFTDTISNLGDIRKKAEDFGWFALSVDGHDVDAIDEAIERCKASDKPGFIDLRTIKGKGWPAKEAVLNNHACRGVAFDGVEDVLTDMRKQFAAMND